VPIIVVRDSAYEEIAAAVHAAGEVQPQDPARLVSSHHTTTHRD